MKKNTLLIGPALAPALVAVTHGVAFAATQQAAVPSAAAPEPYTITAWAVGIMAFMGVVSVAALMWSGKSGRGIQNNENNQDTRDNSQTTTNNQIRITKRLDTW